MEKPKGNLLVGKYRLRWEDNIKMYSKEIGWFNTNFVQLAEGKDQWRALVSTVMTLRVP
jgi:hypothetical protein